MFTWLRLDHALKWQQERGQHPVSFQSIFSALPREPTNTHILPSSRAQASTALLLAPVTLHPTGARGQGVVISSLWGPRTRVPQYGTLIAHSKGGSPALYFLFSSESPSLGHRSQSDPFSPLPTYSTWIYLIALFVNGGFLPVPSLSFHMQRYFWIVCEGRCPPPTPLSSSIPSICHLSKE